MSKEQVFAFICQICPPCIIARKYPRSMVGKFLARERHHCPFCKAYDRIKGIKG